MFGATSLTRLDLVVVEEFQQTFPCQFVSEDSKQCGLTLSCQAILMGHIRLAHGARNLLDMITVTNKFVSVAAFVRREHMLGSMRRE